MPWHPLKCLCGKFTLGQRYVLVIMMQLALLNAYHLRVVLNIAITEMIQDRNVTSQVCPNYVYKPVENIEGGTFEWDHDMEVWGLLAGQLSHNFIFFTLLTDLPKYLKEILKMNVRANATTTALPFLALWVANIFFAYVADFVTNRNLLSLVVARKLYTSFACIVPSLLLILMVYVGCSRVAAQVLVTVAFFLVGPFFSGMKVNVNDITIHYG
uniref:Inorganic phosphate cotransporter n=1 Tax=Diabrotica virgifera virgifera TaxID=50390 RepID=A0A6P7H5H3_DIAVI